MARYLSKKLTYEQATYSGNAVAHGIPNIPDDSELKNLMLWGEKIYDPVCAKFGDVFLSSVFRDDRTRKDKWGKYVSVNSLAGGSPTSGHAKGQCGDLDGDAPNSRFAKVDNNDLFHWVRENLEYDQIIAEYEANGSPKWVHVGFRATGNRKQALIATKDASGKTVYMVYTDALYKRIYGKTRGLDAGFFMPEIDFVTAVDETHDMGYEQEVRMAREAPFDENIGSVVHPVDVKVEQSENGMTLRLGHGGNEVTLKIEVTVNTE